MRRNIWLALSVASAGVTIDRVIRVVNGETEWWNMVSAVVILMMSTYFHLCYRRQINQGNLQGHINPLGK